LEESVLNKESDETEKKIKKKKKITEEEEEEERNERELVEIAAMRKEQEEEARVMMEVSDEEEDRVGLPPREGPVRTREKWMEAWAATFDEPPIGLSLYTMSTRLPLCRGVIMEGHPLNRDILIVGDIGKEDLYCVAGHLLFLSQNGRRYLTTFRTKEEFWRRTGRESPPLDEMLILFIDPEGFMEGIEESTQALPDARDPAWQALWREMRSGLAPQFGPKLGIHSSNLPNETDISLGTWEEDGNHDDAGDTRGGRTWKGRGGSTIRRGDGEEYWSSNRRKRSLVRAARFREETEQGGYDCRKEGHRLRAAARPPSPSSVAPGDGRGRASLKILCEFPVDLTRVHTTTGPYGTAKPLYRPPHQFRATGGLAAAEEREVLPQKAASEGEGTYEHDHSYTHAARYLYRQYRSNKEISEETTNIITVRGDRGSQAA
jgi:hypothetical protein